jgi:hypothetical protein
VKRLGRFPERTGTSRFDPENRFHGTRSIALNKSGPFASIELGLAAKERSVRRLHSQQRQSEVCNIEQTASRERREPEYRSLKVRWGKRVSSI